MVLSAVDYLDQGRYEIVQMYLTFHGLTFIRSSYI